MGVGVVTVEHGTSGMPGMKSLRDHLAERFPAVEFARIAERPRTRTVRGRDTHGDARARSIRLPGFTVIVAVFGREREQT
jgi:hypothetical protein